ncbi:hypothetical protein JTE90_026056 [Oedothorax gibbosus]|uniref:Sulfotransferase domain-containing protein n=1 Tax=Oedothorax gibbosus TaxID=931172 RepID=A0AAV6UC10_9ARAC|nr:hypothetical protein JTE90_026056 [Oedothorax gibbosus]
MNNLSKIQNFICKEDDVIVVSFPKAGTTWLQEIIYCVLNGIDASQHQSLEDRFPYLEFIYPGLASIEKMEGQRLIKTHLPLSILPEDIHKKKPKIFYIMRNPKDVAVSYYHFVRMMTITDYTASFDNFFEDFISDKVAYGPFWKHYTEVWPHRNDPNVLLLYYEDLHKDIHGSIKRIADFLNKDLSEEEINQIADHCSFHNMSKNPNVNYQHWDDLGIRKTNESRFMRKGQIGDWKNYFSEEKNTLMDSWIDEKFMNINFTYDNL